MNAELMEHGESTGKKNKGRKLKVKHDMQGYNYKSKHKSISQNPNCMVHRSMYPSSSAVCADTSKQWESVKQVNFNLLKILTFFY